MDSDLKTRLNFTQGSMMNVPIEDFTKASENGEHVELVLSLAFTPERKRAKNSLLLFSSFSSSLEYLLDYKVQSEDSSISLRGENKQKKFINKEN
ncbi:hypothetical protein EUGRSUZ_D00290 [Eucalyptus grandis]|uniref:Uncharacterized protein n=2 Tax=Eucalyptus grandis TaxID=71139 RepID=A0ACC3L2Q2_EUCGR|nr:hypothetical protein EUGRSUZ_D00290 [Eucalyptus grandis]